MSDRNGNGKKQSVYGDGKKQCMENCVWTVYGDGKKQWKENIIKSMRNLFKLENKMKQLKILETF